MSASPNEPSFANRQAFGPAEDPSLAIAVGDINGDGYLDLVVGNDSGAPGYVYLNDTQGNFYNGRVNCERPPANVRCFSSATESTTDLALGDMDSDGDLDIITGNADVARREGTQNVIYLNDGQGGLHYGAYTCGTTPGVRCFGGGSDKTFAVAVGDLNGDAHLDIVVGNSSEVNVVYFNDGSAGFDNRQGQSFGVGLDSTWSIDLGDINGDGALDIIVGNFGEQNVVYLNQGAGDFYSGPVNCGVTPDVLCLGTGTDTTTGLVVGDINHDSAPDVAIANRGTFDPGCQCYIGEQNTLYLNDGSGSFPATSSFTRTLGLSSEASTAVALGDIDSDGYLDVVAGNDEQPNTVYLNDATSSFAASIDFGTGTGTPWDIALADLDQDGDLDMVLVKDINNGRERGLQNEVYFNNGSSTFATAAHSTLGAADSNSLDVALGDMDADGDLDIVTGSLRQQDTISLNDGSGGFADSAEATTPVGAASSDTQSLAVGDIDADNDLDIVIAQYGGKNAVYFNDGTGSFPAGSFNCGVTPGVSCFGTESDTSTSIALADVDGDNDLDIAVGNDSATGQNVVYLNDGDGRFDIGRVSCDSAPDIQCFGTGSDDTRSIAAGDMDRDGDLDLVVANHSQQNAVYLNDGSGAFPASPDFVRAFGNSSDNSTSVAVGDVNGDGNLDIVIGNQLEQNVVYLNDGAASFYNGPILCGGNAAQVRCFGTGLDRTTSTELADIDGDGDLDIIAGTSQGQSTIYLNDSVGNFPASRPFGTASDTLGGVAAGDIDQDGDTDLVAVYQDGANAIYRNGLVAPVPSAFSQPALVIERPGSTPDADGFSVAAVLEETVIPIEYRLAGRAGQRVGFVRAFYSLDGGGNWLPARNPAGEYEIALGLSLPAGAQVFEWDTFQSGFFGQSDNVVFRIEAYPDVRPAANQPGPRFQRPYLAAQTFPFRVRGTQVQVVDESNAPVAGALVYRLPGGLPIAGGDGQGQDEAFRTNAQGYLEGRGTLTPEQDELIALYPVETTERYTLYYTNGEPDETGVKGHLVQQPGVQTITVSSARPLLLFNLDVSLEWDARNDERFLSRLEFDLRRTSELLYDWTNGQAALGRLTIYHNREEWDTTNIRIYATNRLRPNADQGGIVSDAISETVTLKQEEDVINYEPGQVRMAAVWNRFGDSGGNLSEDWPRTLAHELGHYMFYLDDNYLGLDNEGKLISVETCPGAMSDPYNEGYSEFHPGPDWLPACEETLSNTATGRSDWETISTFYDALQEPDVPFDSLPSGPSTLPLAVTEMDYVETGNAADTVDVPIFYLKDAQGASLQPQSSARAFVFQQKQDTPLADQRLIDVGRPIRDYVEARGIRVGDRLCVFDLANERLGCETISPGDEEIVLEQRPDWQPDIRVSPVTSRTIDVEVLGIPANLNLCGRLFPEDNLAPTAIGLQENVSPGTAAISYTGRFDLPESAPGGYIHVFATDGPANSESCTHMSNSPEQMVTDYSLGGNPGKRRARTGKRRARTGKRRARTTPTVSSDGQVILYGEKLDFDEGTFYAFQEATIIPPEPSWTTPIGQGYRLTRSNGAPDLQGTSISFGYIGSQVPAGEEEWLRIYFWDEQKGEWIKLDTIVDKAQNIASAPTQGEGLYALMSSIEITLEGTGWNLFSYPVNATRPLPGALESIADHYTTIYHYQPDRNGSNRWRVYDVNAPDWLNNDAEIGLQELSFGKAYLINITEPLTVSLKGGSADAQTAGSNLADAVPHPPATYYLEDLAASGTVTATVDMPVTARVGERLCGESSVRSVDNQLVFAIQVQAELPGSINGCGTAGRQVRIDVGGQTVAQVMWNNNRVVPLGETSFSLYLPMVRR